MDLQNLSPDHLGFARFPYRRNRKTWVMVVVLRGSWRLGSDGRLGAVDPNGDEGPPMPAPMAHLGDDVGNPPVAPDGLVPFKPKGDIVVDAVAHAPAGQVVPGIPVAIKVGEWRKELIAVGDRHWKSGLFKSGFTDPEPFTSMPLHLGHALGGRDDDANPFGKGRDAGSKDAPGALPNVELPGKMVGKPGERLPPATFGPITEAHPDRKVSMGRYDGHWLKANWPAVPDDFDWAYFQSAPRDQQVEGYFTGDEQLTFDNLHPEHSRLVIELPRMRARCFVERSGGERAGEGEATFEEVPLNLDTLFARPHEGLVELTWRGLIEVPDPGGEDWGAVVTSLEPLDQVQSPEHYRAAGRAVARAYEDQFEIPDEQEPEAAAWFAAPLPALAPPSPPAAEASEVDAQADAHLDAVRAELEADGIEPGAPGDPVEMLREAAGDEAFLDAADVRAEDLRALADSVQTDLDEARTFADASAGAEAADAAAAPVKDAASSAQAGAGQSAAVFGQVSAAAGADAEDGEASLRAVENPREFVLAARASGASLAQTDLDGADLSQLDLAGADFRDASLASADLTGADLTGAVLAGADLTDAVLEQAKCVKADLQGASLIGANLTGADFRNALCQHATFEQCGLEGVQWHGIALDEAEVKGVALPGIQWSDIQAPGATFTGVDFTGANLVQASLDGAHFRECRMAGADLSRASMVEGSLGGCDGTKIVLRDAILTSCRADEESVLVGADLTRVQGGDLAFGGANLTDAVLRGARLVKAQMQKVVLDGANLDAADLTGASLDDARVRRASLLKAKLVGAGLARTDFTGSDLRGAKLYSAGMDETVMHETRLEDADLGGTIVEARQ